MTGPIIFWLSGGVVVVVILILVLRTNSRLSVAITRGENDDNEAARYFRELVCDMEKQMIIHDDGDSTCTTLYNNDEVVEAVKERLLRDSHLAITCLFNKRDSIKMIDLVDDLPNFKVFYVPEDDQKNGIHYKIIDRGRKAYLSKHCPGSTDRQYELVDCSAAPKRGQKMFADLHNEFDQRLKAAICHSRA